MDPELVQQQELAKLEDKCDKLKEQLEELKALVCEYEKDLREAQIENADLLQRIQDLAFGSGRLGDE